MITSIAQLKQWFKSGLKPLETQYHSWIDSYWHKSENIPMGNITNLSTTLQNFVTQNQITNITNALLPIQTTVFQAITVTIGIGKLLELVVVEANATTDIEIIYNGNVLISEQISETTAFRVDTYMNIVDSINITSTIDVQAKIYTR